MAVLERDILTKDDFIREISARSGFSLLDSRDLLDTIIEIFSDCMKQRLELHVSGFGKLTHTLIPKRVGSKPSRGKIGSTEKVEYPEATRSNFKLATNLRELSKGEN